MSDASTKHHRQKDLLAYAQNFLDSQQQREIEEHLRTCADCRETLEEVRRFLPALQQALTPQEVPTEEMWAKVQRQFRNRPPPNEPFFRRMRLTVLVGSMALAAGILIVIRPLLRQHRSETIAKQLQHQGGYMAAPHPQNQSGYVVAPQRPAQALDAGQDAGTGMDHSREP